MDPKWLTRTIDYDCDDFDLDCKYLKIKNIKNKLIKVTKANFLTIEKCENVKIIYKNKYHLKILSSTVEFVNVIVDVLTLRFVKNLIIANSKYGDISIYHCKNITISGNNIKILIISKTSGLKLERNNCSHVLELRRYESVDLKNFVDFKYLRIVDCGNIYSSKPITLKDINITRCDKINLKLVTCTNLEFNHISKILLTHVGTSEKLGIYNCSKILCPKKHSLKSQKIFIRDCRFVNLNFNLDHKNLTFCITNSAFCYDHIGKINISSDISNNFLKRLTQSM